MGSLVELARKLRLIIEQAVQSLDDKTASDATELFSGMRYEGCLIKVGTRINWNGKLKQAAVDLWDYAENNPENAPTLWQDISYRKGIRIIPSVITVTEAFAKGERGWWGENVYESLVASNTYTPEQYAPNWRVIEGGETGDQS